jgi:hypothetical protein
MKVKLVIKTKLKNMFPDILSMDVWSKKSLGYLFWVVYNSKMDMKNVKILLNVALKEE